MQSSADLKGPTCVRIALLGGPVQGFLRPVGAEAGVFCSGEDPQDSAYKVLEVRHTPSAVGLAGNFNVGPGGREVITAGKKNECIEEGSGGIPFGYNTQ